MPSTATVLNSIPELFLQKCEPMGTHRGTGAGLNTPQAPRVPAVSLVGIWHGAAFCLEHSHSLDDVLGEKSRQEDGNRPDVKQKWRSESLRMAQPTAQCWGQGEKHVCVITHGEPGREKCRDS